MDIMHLNFWLQFLFSFETGDDAKKKKSDKLILTYFVTSYIFQLVSLRQTHWLGTPYLYSHNNKISFGNFVSPSQEVSYC